MIVNDQNRNCPCGAEQTRREGFGANCSCNRQSGSLQNRSCPCSHGESAFQRRVWGSSCNGYTAAGSGSCSCQRRNEIAENVIKSADTTWKNRSLGCGCGTVSRSTGCGCGEAMPRTTGCGHSGACDLGATPIGCLSDRSLAMVYAPHQDFEELYDPRKGLCSGTVFCQLDKPFHGSGR